MALAAMALLCGRASASCNQIPGTANFFRGARGSLDRPFAGPGALVTVQLSPACDAPSAGFTSDAVVSVAFAAAGTPRRLIVLAPSCAAIDAERQRCSEQSAVMVECLERDASSIIVEDPLRLRFRFPDTDALSEAANDDRTLAGSAAIAVSAAEMPLPCDLGEAPCKDQTSLVACIDTLFTIDGTCGTSADATFSHFTALPPPNDYQALCNDPIPPCTARADEFRFTVDAAGNILIPMDWRGILVGGAVPVARLLRTTFGVDAFPDRTGPIRLPGNAFLHSYSLNGGLLPPIFEPQADATAQDELVLFGSADAPETVLQIFRRSPLGKECEGGPRAAQPCTASDECGSGTCGPAHCVGGQNDGAACRNDDDCAGAPCGHGLFDFASRGAQHAGLVVIPRFGSGVCIDSGRPCAGDAACTGSRCVSYRIAAKEPVALDGLIDSDSLFISVVPEAINGIDLNGDGDATDDALLLADRKSGKPAPIGEDSAAGRAATRLRQPPFSYPAVIAEGDVVAFLEAEPLQGNVDANGDGDRFDTILRVYRQSDGTTQELTAGMTLAVDAAPLVNHRSLVIADGRVFLRRRESASAPRRIVRASVDSRGESADGPSQLPSLSKDGRHVAFESSAANLVAAPSLTTEPTTYVRDLRTGRTTRVTLPDDRVPPDAAAQTPWISGDGRYVVVSAMGVNGWRQILAYDRDQDGDGIFDEPDQVEGVIISFTGDETNGKPSLGGGDSTYPSITPDGRFVVFSTLSPYADPLVLNWSGAMIRADRDPHGTGFFDRSVSGDRNWTVTLSGSRLTMGEVLGGGHIPMQPSAISADGRFVGFASLERNLAFRDLNDFCLTPGTGNSTCMDILVRDTVREVITLQSVSSSGEQANNHSLTPAMSADGSVIAFESAATNLVAGDTNDAFDVFVRDLASETTTRVSVAADGRQANGSSFGRSLSLSEDGRFVAFASRASNLVAGDGNEHCLGPDGRRFENCSDIFVHDRLTGFTERISATSAGGEGDGRSGHPSLSGDGATVAFESSATTLAAGGARCGNGVCSAILVAGHEVSASNDLNGDGDVDDVVLQVFDTTHAERGVQTLAPAEAVAIAGDRVAFLVPEAAEGIDLNGDGDSSDLVVHLYRDGGVVNLQRSAIDLVVSPAALAVRTKEAAEGGSDLNDDGDHQDTVAAVYDFAAGAWQNLGIAAAAIGIDGDSVVLAAVEAEQGRDLNADGDSEDRVLYTYSARGGVLISSGLAVAELVTGAGIVAFRVPEAAQGGNDLNGDGDVRDSVLHVLDLNSREVINTAQAATPCRLTACDPRLPFRVFDGIVKFLTLEAEQGEDLNGDGDQTDLVLQMFNLAVGRRSAGLARAARVEVIHQMRSSRTQRRQDGMRSGALTAIGAVSAGICTDSGQPCALQSDCHSGARCYLPPGGCVERINQACDTQRGDGGCDAGDFCVPTLVPGRGACHRRHGPCASDADCTAPARCQESGATFQQLAAPLASAGPGQEIFIAGCEGGAERCAQPLIVAAAGDADGDGIADPFDNCARLANADQRDDDDDGVGDACELPLATPRASPTITPEAPTPTRTATPLIASAGTGSGCNLSAGTADAKGWIGLLPIVLLVQLRRRVPRPTRSRARERLSEEDNRQQTDRQQTSAFQLSQLTRFHVRRNLGVCCLSVCCLLSRRVLRQSRATVDADARRRCFPPGFNASRQRLPFPCLAVLAGTGLGLAVAMFHAKALAAASTCPGDCDASGLVDVADLVARVCPVADTNSDGSISITERLAAIDTVLHGCASDAELQALTRASLLQALSRLPLVEPIMGLGLAGAGSSGTCGGGGGYASRCETQGEDRIRLSLDVDHCADATLEGYGTITGTVSLSAFGVCPRLLVAGSLVLGLALTVGVVDAQGEPLLLSTIDITSRVDSFFFDRPPCRVRGGAGIMNGSISYDASGGRATTIVDDLHTTFVLSQFQLNPICEPGVVAATLDGHLKIEDRGTQPLAVHARGLKVTRNRLAQSVVIDGNATCDVLGGELDLHTIEPLVMGVADPQPISGRLAIRSGGSVRELRFP